MDSLSTAEGAGQLGTGVLPKQPGEAGSEVRSEDKFCHYDRVGKVSGYEFPGTVVSVFFTLDGKRRYVVEHAISRGMLHIFSGSQLIRSLND